MQAAVKIGDIPEINGGKRSEWVNTFTDFFKIRQGATTDNIWAQELAGRAFTPDQVYGALKQERAMSLSDLPDILNATQRALPQATIRAEHRLFTDFIKVRDFLETEFLSASNHIKVTESFELANITPQIIDLNAVSGQLRSFRTRVLVSRHLFVNDSAWLKPLRDSAIMSLIRKEGELVYDVLEAASFTNTIAGSAAESKIAEALTTFRGITESGEYLNAVPEIYVVPPSLEVVENKAIKDAGLNIRVVSHQRVTACYLLSSDCPAITRIGLNAEPHIEINKPNFQTDSIATVDGYLDSNAFFNPQAPAVKVTL